MREHAYTRVQLGDPRVAAPVASCVTIALAGCAVALAGCAHEAATSPVLCRCQDGAVGEIGCHALGGQRVCGCTTGGSTCPIFATEDCDGIDNDGDGRIDNGEVCADPSVTSAVPFTGAVYLQGTLRESSCGYDALQRFWPTLAASYTSGFDCYADWYRFRRSDGALYYLATFAGIREDHLQGDPVIPTPPCGTMVDRGFDFDAAGGLYYTCFNPAGGRKTLWKTGATVTDDLFDFAGALDDGRVIVTRFDHDGAAFVVLDGSGHELSRLSPSAEFAGELIPLSSATTVAGNRGYVAYARQYPINQREVVVFTVDERSAWSRVRRASVPGFGNWLLVLSDGTILVREGDPTTSDAERIVAFPADGTSRIVWREAEQTVVRAHGLDEMLIGPP